MDKREAHAILSAELEKRRAIAYRDLVEQLLDRPEAFEVKGPSGATYQIEIEAFWDDESQQNLRVLGSIDDGGWRAFIPLCDDFIVAPDGTFVDE